MNDKLFTTLWVGALVGIAVCEAFHWFTALEVLAFALWWWVMTLHRELNAVK